MSTDVKKILMKLVKLVESLQLLMRKERKSILICLNILLMLPVIFIFIFHSYSRVFKQKWSFIEALKNQSRTLEN